MFRFFDLEKMEQKNVNPGKYIKMIEVNFEFEFKS